MKNQSAKLTPLQLDILQFIGDYIRRHGYSPSTVDINTHLGIARSAGSAYHVDALVRKGYLTKAVGIARSIRLTGKHVEVKE